MLMGNSANTCYESTRSPGQNLMRFVLRHRDLLPTAHRISFDDMDISLEGESENEVVMPDNFVFINCRFNSPGRFIFFHGEVTATVSGAKVVGKGNDAISNADVDGSEAWAIAPCAISNANASGATAHALGPNTVANVNENGAKGHANGAGALTVSRVQGGIVEAVNGGTARPFARNQNRHLGPSIVFSETIIISGSLRGANSSAGPGAGLALPPELADMLPMLLSFTLASLHGILDESEESANQVSGDEAHTYWYDEAKATLGADAIEKWNSLKDQPNFAGFKTMLARLSADGVEDKVVPSDVVEVIQSVLNSPTARELILKTTKGADADCHERPLSLFHTVQGYALFDKYENSGATPGELLDLAKGIAKHTLLDEAALKVMHKQWQEKRLEGNKQNTGPNTKESLEWQMALRQKLTIDLRLPVGVNSLHAIEIARLTEEDVAFAKNYVNEAMSDESRLVFILLNEPIWRSYMERYNKAEIEKIDTVIGQASSKLEDDLGKNAMTESEYNVSIVSLNKEREIKTNVLLASKTLELCRAAQVQAQNQGQTSNSSKKEDSEKCIVS